MNLNYAKIGDNIVTGMMILIFPIWGPIALIGYIANKYLNK